MATNSIFDKIVIYENSQTQLLLNVLVRYEEFRVKFLALFLPPEVASKVRPHHIRPQVSLREGGRPDLTIETECVSALIEVKTSTRCELGDNQNIHEDLRGYAGYLISKDSKCRCLGYLIPRNWEGRQKLENARDASKQLGGVKCKIVHWEQVLAIIENLQNRDALLEEYRKFLVQRFWPIRFNKEEIQMLSSSAFLATFLNLTYLIRQIEEKCKKEFKTHWETTRDENAFYIQPKGDKEFFLYFGMWKDFAEQEGSPICYGVRDAWGSAETFSMICARDNLGVKPFGDNDDRWTLLPIVPVEDEDAVESLWQQLGPILQEIAMSNRKQKTGPTPIRA